MAEFPRYRRNRWIGWSVAAVVAAGILAGLVVFFDRLTRPPLTEEQRIGAAVESFLDACRDRDYEAVWEFQSRVTHRVIAAQRADLGAQGLGVRADLDDEEFFVANAEARNPGRLPDDPADWYPWELPASVLDDLAIVRIDDKPDPSGSGALVELRPLRNGRIGSRRARLELGLAREKAGWRLHLISFYLTEYLPARSRRRGGDGWP